MSSTKVVHRLRKKSSRVWEYFVEKENKYKCIVITDGIPCNHGGFTLTTNSNLSDHLHNVHKINESTKGIQQLDSENMIVESKQHTITESFDKANPLPKSQQSEITDLLITWLFVTLQFLLLLKKKFN